MRASSARRALFSFGWVAYKNGMPQRRRSDSLPKRDPIREVIAARAYEVFLARGGTHGQDVEDWLKAEHELMDRRQSDGMRRRLPDTNEAGTTGSEPTEPR
jgi:hypothetical protein